LCCRVPSRAAPLSELGQSRPECVELGRRIAAHWNSKGGTLGFGVGSMFPLVEMSQRPGSNLWPAAIYRGGKVELVFQHQASRPPFDQESAREDLRLRINVIGVTPLPEGSLSRRPGFDLAELAAGDRMDRFPHRSGLVLEHRVVASRVDLLRRRARPVFGICPCRVLQCERSGEDVEV
jgi:hypothetical protein